MLNILTVLQELALPIKKEKVDLMCPYNSETSPILIKDDESRINCSKDKFLEWVGTLDKKSFEKPTFNTEIFFLTLNAHHLSIISILNKYMRRIRVIKELNR